MKAKITEADFDFFCEIRVRYAEVDAQGIVFNAHYLTYFDVAVTEYFRGISDDYETFVKEAGIDFHVFKSTVEYKSPARFDDLIRIGIKGSYKGSKLFWQLAIFKDGELLTTGELAYATVNADNYRPVRISEDVALKLRITKQE